MIFPNDGSLLIANQTGPYNSPDDQLTILSASIADDVLSVEFEFGGGCRDHDIGIIADRNWSYDEFPQINLWITHDSNGDVCRALMRESRHFQLTPLLSILADYSGPVKLNLFAPAETSPYRPAQYWNVGDADDTLQIAKASVLGDTLSLDVQYGGGCREHQISVYWIGDWLESFPPQVTLQVTHNANNDPCDAWITERRFFDLRFLVDANPNYHGDVLLRIRAPGETEVFTPLPVFTIP